MEKREFKPGVLGLAAFDFDTLTFDRRGSRVRGVGITSTGALKGGWATLTLEFGPEHWTNDSPVYDKLTFEDALATMTTHRLFDLDGPAVLARATYGTILTANSVWSNSGYDLHNELRLLLSLHDDVANLPANFDGWYKIPTVL